MIAEVILKTAKSYATGGRRYVQGKVETLTDPAEIKALQANSAFSVTILPEPERKASRPAPAPEPEKKPAASNKAKSPKRVSSKAASSKKGK